MQKKIAAAMLLASAVMLPSFVSAEQLPTAGQLFPNRGACESVLKQARNTVRQELVRPAARTVGEQGQAGAAANQVANPVIKQFCQAVTGKDGKTLGFKIVEG